MNPRFRRIGCTGRFCEKKEDCVRYKLYKECCVVESTIYRDTKKECNNFIPVSSRTWIEK